MACAKSWNKVGGSSEQPHGISVLLSLWSVSLSSLILKRLPLAWVLNFQEQPDPARSILTCLIFVVIQGRASLFSLYFAARDSKTGFIISCSLTTHKGSEIVDLSIGEIFGEHLLIIRWIYHWEWGGLQTREASRTGIEMPKAFYLSAWCSRWETETHIHICFLYLSHTHTCTHTHSHSCSLSHTHTTKAMMAQRAGIHNFLHTSQSSITSTIVPWALSTEPRAVPEHHQEIRNYKKRTEDKVSWKLWKEAGVPYKHAWQEAS